MRQALILWNGDEVVKNHKNVMRITGDDAQGKAELDNFILPESIYPVIATTSKLLNTGVDACTCKLIVLDQNIQSMTTFKQIIGRARAFWRSMVRPGSPSWISSGPLCCLLIRTLTAIPFRFTSLNRWTRPSRLTHRPDPDQTDLHPPRRATNSVWITCR
jgi:hypothetical protein